jgi:hypothetical protein
MEETAAVTLDTYKQAGAKKSSKKGVKRWL